MAWIGMQLNQTLSWVLPRKRWLIACAAHWSWYVCCKCKDRRAAGHDVAGCLGDYWRRRCYDFLSHLWLSCKCGIVQLRIPWRSFNYMDDLDTFLLVVMKMGANRNKSFSLLQFKPLLDSGIGGGGSCNIYPGLRIFTVTAAHRRKYCCEAIYC